MMQRTAANLVVIGIGCLQGGYMLIDGIHEITTGSYIGGRVGPWGALVRAVGVNEYSMGPIFIGLGALWLVGCAITIFAPRRGRLLLAIAAVISLLYAFFGTLLAMIELILLWRQRELLASSAGAGK